MSDRPWFISSYIQGSNFALKTTLAEYLENLYLAMNQIKGLNYENLSKLEREIVLRLDGSSEVHIIGNGGSAANAHHVVGDYTKTFAGYSTKLRITTIADNGCYLTASANDIDYSEVYSYLIPNRITPGDLIILLSGSGNSANLVKCARKARDYGICTSAISAYGGGELSKVCTIPLAFDCQDMEIAEDLQVILFHILKQSICKYLDSHGAPKVKLRKYDKRVTSGEIA